MFDDFVEASRKYGFILLNFSIKFSFKSLVCIIKNVVADINNFCLTMNHSLHHKLTRSKLKTLNFPNIESAQLKHGLMGVVTQY